MERGPAANDAVASRAFVDMWGAKTERGMGPEGVAGLRRFKDGAIVEAVIWSEHPEFQSKVGPPHLFLIPHILFLISHILFLIPHSSYFISHPEQALFPML